MCSAKARSSCGGRRIDQDLQRVDLVFEPARLRQEHRGGCVMKSVTSSVGLPVMRGSVLYSAAKRLSLAPVAGASATCTKRRLRLHGGELHRGEEAGALVQLVARVVIAEHQRMPQVQIEQRLRRDVVR